MLPKKDITILLIDDDSVDIMGVKRAFKKVNMEGSLVVASDGIDALEKLRDGKSIPRPYMVLLDINMPRMNGFDFLKATRDDPKLKESVIFMLTTSRDDNDRHKAYRHNVAGYIVKSEDREGFINVAGLMNHYSKVVELP